MHVYLLEENLKKNLTGVHNMNCDYYKKLLHLNRPGELTVRQQKKLEKHLNKCPVCYALKLKIEKMDEVVQTLKEQKPVLSDPNTLTKSIIQEISKPEIREIKKQSSIFEQIQNIFSMGRFRYSAAAFASALLLLFMIQQIYIVNKIGSLETRISNVSSDNKKSENTVEISSESIRKLFDVSRLPKIKNNALYRQLVSGETVTIDLKTLRSWMEKYETLQNENMILKILIRDRFPDFDEQAFEKELKSLKDRKLEIYKLLYRKL
jgi:hypothetical protein